MKPSGDAQRPIVARRLVRPQSQLGQSVPAWPEYVTRQRSLHNRFVIALRNATCPTLLSRQVRSPFLPAEAPRRTFRTVNPPLNLEPSWNVAPTQSAPVVRRHPETGERHLDLLTWGPATLLGEAADEGGAPEKASAGRTAR